MSPRTVVLVLGAAQTLAWASSFYLPAMLALPMAADLGVSRPDVYAGLSMALIVAALVGPGVGRQIDRLGGRSVLLASTALFVVGLAALGSATGPWTLGAAWMLLGLAMGLGLYDAAFATLVRLYGTQSRQAITGITLIAGLASTVGWPLTALMEGVWGWRGACFGWVALHLVVGLPLNALLPRMQASPTGSMAARVLPGVRAGASATVGPTEPLAATTAVAVRLALLFTLMGFVGTAVATHLPALLMAGGLGLTAAVALAALAGPAQVLARVLEFGLLRRWSPLVSARCAAAGHPLGVLVLFLGGPPVAVVFVVLHGMGNGLLTIVRGTLPLAVFGAAGYGRRQGWIVLPGRIVGALSPWLFGLALDAWGQGALLLSASMGLSAVVLLAVLRLPQASVT